MTGKLPVRLLLLAIALFAFSGCVFVKVPLSPGEGPAREHVVSGKGRGKIVVVDLSGMLTLKPFGLERFSRKPGLLQRVREELDLAREDSRVVGIVVRIDSPGGSVTASDILYHEILSFSIQSQLPVVACVMDRAFSGGYYAALAADEIMVHPTSTVGAVGVISFKLNVAGLLDKWGVQTEVVKSGPWKDFWSPLRPSHPEETVVMQGMTDRLHSRFLGLVQERRQLSDMVMKEVAKGGVFDAPQAEELGLVDRIGYLDDAVARVKELAGVEKARVVIYRRPGAAAATIYSSALPSLSGLSLIGDSLSLGVDPRFHYLFLP